MSVTPTETSTEARPPRRRRTFRLVEVGRVRPLTPQFTRVTFTGDSLAGYTSQAPAEHIKILLSGPDQDAPALPAIGPDGPIYIEGAPRPPMRTYTPRRFDAGTLELDVDFLQHGSGPGATWATYVRPGDRAIIVGPGGGYAVAAEPGPYVLAGDESALPAIATVLEALPSGARASVYLEVLDANEELTLASDADVRVTWLHRQDPGALAGDLLVAALHEIHEPAEARYLVACEASAMRSIRRHLLTDRGIDRERLTTRGYWKYGESNHPDHDTGED